MIIETWLNFLVQHSIFAVIISVLALEAIYAVVARYWEKKYDEDMLPHILCMKLISGVGAWTLFVLVPAIIDLGILVAQYIRTIGIVVGSIVGGVLLIYGYYKSNEWYYKKFGKIETKEQYDKRMRPINTPIKFKKGDEIVCIDSTCNDDKYSDCDNESTGLVRGKIYRVYEAFRDTKNNEYISNTYSTGTNWPMVYLDEIDEFCFNQERFIVKPKIVAKTISRTKTIRKKK